MVTANGYSIVQYPNQNRIAISLHQTWDTLTDTTGILRNRRNVLTAEDEAILLDIVMELYEGDMMEEQDGTD